VNKHAVYVHNCVRVLCMECMNSPACAFDCVCLLVVFVPCGVWINMCTYDCMYGVIFIYRYIDI
jgi:hypothetical protein